MRARSERRSTSTFRARQESAHDPPAGRLVRPEHPERIAVQRMCERLGFVPGTGGGEGAVRTFMAAPWRENARGQMGEALYRNRNPRGTVRGLIGKLVGRLLDQEKVEQLAAAGFAGALLIRIQERLLRAVAQALRNATRCSCGTCAAVVLFGSSVAAAA